MKYHKKPIPVDAEVYREGLEDGWEYEDQIPEDVTITQAMFAVSKVDGVRLYPYIQTLEGRHFITQGDYIITGVEGERYPCKERVFLRTYEPVPESVAGE